MLNRVILMGRITHDLEIKQTNNGIPVLSFQLAVERSFTRQGEERQSDFIRCTAWRQQAEFINKWFGKGRLIAIEGQLRSNSYDDKNGVKHNTVEVMIDSASFTGEKANGGNGGNYGGGYGNNGGYGGGYPQQGGGYGGNGGYQQGGNYGGYNGGYGGGYGNDAPIQPPPMSGAPGNNNQAPKSEEPISIGEYQDFQVFGGEGNGDDGVPF
jgi:single-strand DNA-binding protein